MYRVKDKVIIVTGAASGLGLADASVLAREGAKVIMTDIDPEAGQAHADAIGAHFITQDVSEEASWVQVMDEVAHLCIKLRNASLSPTDYRQQARLVFRPEALTLIRIVILQPLPPN